MNTLYPLWLDWPQVRTLIDAFARAQTPFRFVGGCVRDALLGVVANDIDAATTAAPEQVMDILQAAGIRAIPTGLPHGTVTAVIGGKSFEITTLRKDVETDGRHAKVIYTDDWQADASRRDFTINAFYLSPEGALHDYFSGRDDLRKGTVRFIGDPAQRIKEDYLRILRFFRFYAYYGRNAPDTEALTACAAAAHHIDILSGERIQQEALKLLAAPHPAITLALMQAQGIAPHVFGVPVDERAMAHLAEIEAWAGAPPRALRRLAVIIRDTGGAAWIEERWRLSRPEWTQLRLLQRYLPGDITVAEQKKQLRDIGLEAFKEATMVSAAIAYHEDFSPYQSMISSAEANVPPPFPVTGNDLKQCGLEEGKMLGEALRQLEEAWEESNYALTREQLLKQIA
jgi:poly(A) polymerase